MKKNKMLRIASILLVVTLLSTCVISGTFAKYVTKATGEDQARVAKWGVLVSVEGDSVFKTEYDKDDQTYGGTVTVKSSNTDKVVAPGTTSGKLSGSVKGTPEVATRYALTIPSDWTDIVLPAGTYTDYTEYVLGKGYSKTFTLANDYAPIKWDVVAKDASGNVILSLLSVAADKIGVSVDDLNTAGVRGFSATEAKMIIPAFAPQLKALILEKIPSAKSADVKVESDGSIVISCDFEPGKPVDYTFELTWVWAFEGPTASVTSTNISDAVLDAETVDKADTLLGNLMAAELDGITLPIAEGATDPMDNEKTSLWINGVVTASATQID